MEFVCNSKTKSRSESWKGQVVSLNDINGSYELRIESRSSIHVIVGKTKHGGFACMPDFGAGCHIANFRDIFWNTEKLVKVLGKVDGITVGAALYALADKFEI